MANKLELGQFNNFFFNSINFDVEHSHDRKTCSHSNYIVEEDLEIRTKMWNQVQADNDFNNLEVSFSLMQQCGDGESRTCSGSAP